MKIATLLFLSMPLALAHPGHEEPEHELAYKRHFNAQARRGLNACSEQLAKRGVHQRAQERRAAKVERYRKAYGLQARDTDSVANTSHLSNESYTPDTAETTIFGTSNTCVVNPEGETGPYWVKGEYIRSNLRESQTGVPIVIEGQFLDIETCSPLTNVWWDIWNCNATGVYGGVVEQGNGNTADTANINATFLRGIQQADSDGVVTFESIFPGHYSGRTTHHHMVVHVGATVAENNTLVGGTYAHVGQVFWDQDLIEKVEATSPYSTNTIAITENADDRVFSTETTDTTSDPVFEYVYLGDDLSDGLFGWITVVVNTSATYDPNYSFALTSSGGVAESGGSMTVDGGSGSGNGSASGGPPSGGFPGSNSTSGGDGPGGNSTSGGVGPDGSSTVPGSNGTATALNVSSTTSTNSATSTSSTTPVVTSSGSSASRSTIATTALAAGSMGVVASLLSSLASGSLGFKTSFQSSGISIGAPHGRPSGDPDASHRNQRPHGGSVHDSNTSAHNSAPFDVPVTSEKILTAPTVPCSA